MTFANPDRLYVSGLVAAIAILVTACIQDLWAVAVQAPAPESFWSLFEARSLTLLTGAISFAAAYRVTAYKVDALKEVVAAKADHKVVELMTERIHDKLDNVSDGQKRLDDRLDLYGKAIIEINATLARAEGEKKGRQPR